MVYCFCEYLLSEGNTIPLDCIRLWKVLNSIYSVLLSLNSFVAEGLELENNNN